MGKPLQPVPIHHTTPTPPSHPPIRPNFITPLTNYPGNISVPAGRAKLPRVAVRGQRAFGCNSSSLGPPLPNGDPPSFPTSQQASKALSSCLLGPSEGPSSLSHDQTHKQWRGGHRNSSTDIFGEIECAAVTEPCPKAKVPVYLHPRSFGHRRGLTIQRHCRITVL